MLPSKPSPSLHRFAIHASLEVQVRHPAFPFTAPNPAVHPELGRCFAPFLLRFPSSLESPGRSIPGPPVWRGGNSPDCRLFPPHPWGSPFGQTAADHNAPGKIVAGKKTCYTRFISGFRWPRDPQRFFVSPYSLRSPCCALSPALVSLPRRSRLLARRSPLLPSKPSPSHHLVSSFGWPRNPQRFFATQSLLRSKPGPSHPDLGVRRAAL